MSGKNDKPLCLNLQAILWYFFIKTWNTSISKKFSNNHLQ